MCLLASTINDLSSLFRMSVSAFGTSRCCGRVLAILSACSRSDVLTMSLTIIIILYIYYSPRGILPLHLSLSKSNANFFLKAIADQELADILIRRVL
jgi:hypothetical protein